MEFKKGDWVFILPKKQESFQIKKVESYMDSDLFLEVFNYYLDNGTFICFHSYQLELDVNKIRKEKISTILE